MSAVTERPVSEKTSHESITLNEARAILDAALGDNSQKYFKHVREWFKLRTSKDVIDNVARRYLKHERLMVYHETFILSLLNKAGGLKETSQAAASQIVFPDGLVCPRMSKHYRPASPVLPRVELVARHNPCRSLPMKTPPLGAAVKKAQYACLPSRALMHGRLLLTSWEHGLQGVHPDAPKLVLEALRTLLKNLVTAIVDDIKPFRRFNWHLYNVESDASVMAEEIWCRGSVDEEDARLLEENERRTQRCLLLGRGGGPAYDDPECWEGASTLSTSSGPQPEEADTTLRLSDVFYSLRGNPQIIPQRSISSRTKMRTFMNMIKSGQSAEPRVIT